MNKIAAIQLNSFADVKKNLAIASELITKATQRGAQLIVLPENVAFMGRNEGDMLKIRETFGTGLIQDFFAQQAEKNNIWLVAGTIPIKSKSENKIHSACLVFDATGKCIARYDKIHLFDVQVQREVEVYNESQTIERGNQIAIIDSPVGRLGLAICYDIRFPELFRLLSANGAQLIAVPSAFTAKTGKAHWELLMRARAVENLCYMIGADQTGTHENGRQTFGHSMIVNPWGEILDCLPHDIGIVTADIDLKKLQEIREDFPVLSHRRFT